MFNLNSRYFIIYPSVSWKLLDFAAPRQMLISPRERYQQAWLGYQDNLLTALREVEDALLSYSKEQDHHAALADAVASALDSVDIARDQYKQGLVDFLQVLDAQRAVAVRQDQLAPIRQALATNLVLLYKSLGGGWEIDASRREAEASAAAK